MKDCTTGRGVICRELGKDSEICGNYHMSPEEERKLQIEERAEKDYLSNDDEYNRGLMAIRSHGYWHVSGYSAVKYWCTCNNL